jgi:hypothetical protein
MSLQATESVQKLQAAFGVSRVASISLCLHAVATTPAESSVAFVALFPNDGSVE